MNLKQIGLSDYEEKAYTALIRLGKSTASVISRESKVSYGKIYEVLASLEQKGLINTVPDKTKMFIAQDPKRLIDIISSKVSELSALKIEVQNLKQIYESQEEECIQTIKGKNNFYKIIRQMQPPKKFKYTIKYTSEFHPEWAREDKKIFKTGINIKSLCKYDKSTIENVKKWLTVHPNIRPIENTGVAIDLREKEIIITLINHNTLISIKDESFIKLMKILFENAYNNSKQIN